MKNFAEMNRACEILLEVNAPKEQFVFTTKDNFQREYTFLNNSPNFTYNVELPVEETKFKTIAAITINGFTFYFIDPNDN